MASEHASAMTGSLFNAKFKQLVAVTGRDASSFSSHSFCRGGASWALQCGVPGEVVQSLGDWRSDCYKQYLDALPQSVHDNYHRLLIKFLPITPSKNFKSFSLSLEVWRDFNNSNKRIPCMTAKINVISFVIVYRQLKTSLCIITVGDKFK